MTGLQAWNKPYDSKLCVMNTGRRLVGFLCGDGLSQGAVTAPDGQPGGALQRDEWEAPRVGSPAREGGGPRVFLRLCLGCLTSD